MKKEVYVTEETHNMLDGYRGLVPKGIIIEAAVAHAVKNVPLEQLLRPEVTGLLPEVPA